jgi:hypothetical protein
MSPNRPARICIVSLALLALGAVAFAQPYVRGSTGPRAPAPADVVAEVRGGLAWFPYEVGRGRIGSDGAFELQFREGPAISAEATTSIERLFDGLRCEDVTISDPTARVLVVRELRVIPRDDPCEYCKTLGTLYLATQERGRLGATGDVEVHWVHADRDVSVQGRCRHGWGEEAYALDLVAGWNTVAVETTALLPSDGFCDCREVSVTVAPVVPHTVAWHFVPTR